jgi:hypothetical protein
METCKQYQVTIVLTDRTAGDLDDLTPQLSNIPLRWMMREAMTVEILFDFHGVFRCAAIAQTWEVGDDTQCMVARKPSLLKLPPLQQAVQVVRLLGDAASHDISTGTFRTGPDVNASPVHEYMPKKDRTPWTYRLFESTWQRWSVSAEFSSCSH